MSLTNLMMKNRKISTALMQLAMVASPLSLSAAASAYYSSRRGAYGLGGRTHWVDPALARISRGWVDNNSKAYPRRMPAGDGELTIRKASVKEVLVVDQNITDYRQFSQLVKPGVELVEIPQDADGLSFLMHALAQYDGLNAVHVVSHARAGELLLGNAPITADILKTHPEFAGVVNQAIKVGGDLLLYGCELGKDAAGGEFLEVIKASTHVDVAASDNLTGNAAFDGDWELEIQKGDIEAKPLANSVAMRDFTEVLQVTTTIGFDVSTYVDDSGAYGPNGYSPASNVQFNVDSYVLTIDGENGYTATFTTDRVYNQGGNTYIETKTTFSFSANATFKPKSITLFNLCSENTQDVTITTDNGGSISLNDLAAQTDGGTAMVVDISSLPVASQLIITGNIDGNNTNDNSSGTGKTYLMFEELQVDDLGTVSSPSAPDLTAGSDSGSSNTDNLTNDTTPTFTGTAGAGVTVRLYADDVEVGSVTADGSGNWTITSTPLDEGTYDMTARADDGAGNLSAPSSSLSVTIDVTGPVVSTPDLTDASDSGSSNTDNRTNVSRPEFTGTAPAGTFIQLFIDYAGNGDATDPLNEFIGTGTAGAGGTWSITSTVDLYPGTSSIKARGQDDAGNFGAASSSVNVTIDITPPAAVPAVPDLVPGSDTGSSDSDNLTNDTTPTFSGTYTANNVVRLYANGVLVGSATANGSGNWTITSDALGAGTYSFTARGVDLAGNEGTASSSLSVTIDVTGPVVSTPDLADASDSGSSNTDNITNVRRPEFTGTAPAGTVIQLFIDNAGNGDATDPLNEFIGTGTAGPGGTWAITSTVDLYPGTWSIKARGQDDAGNFGAASSSVNVTIDITPPAAVPAVPDLVPGSDTGSSDSDNLTNDTTPTFSGTYTANNVVRLYANGELVGSATANGSGNWTITSDALGAGTYSFTARGVDLAGNEGTASNGLSVTIDNTAPAAPSTPDMDADSDTGSSDSDNNTDDTTPTFSGTGAEANATVYLYVGGVEVGESTADGSGNWSVTVSAGMALDAGDYFVVVRTIDAAGNLSDASGALPIHINTAPTANGNLSQTVSYTEDPGGSVALGDIVVSDIDPGDAITATLTLSDPSAGTLSTGTYDSATSTYNAGTGVWTVTGLVADVNAALAAVAFTPSADHDQNFTITTRIRDAAGTGPADGTISVTVTAVNDAPVITAAATIAVTEDIEAALTGISFSDVDAGSGSVTVTLSVPRGSLAAASNGSVTVGGTSSALTLSGTIANINAFIASGSVAYATVLNETDDVTLTVTINDGGNTGTGGAKEDAATTTLQVAAVNDAPVNTVPGGQTVDQGGVLVFSAANSNAISVADVDAGGGIIQVTLTAANGLLTLSGTTGLTFSAGDGTDDGTMAFEGTIADINLALAGLEFAPTGGYNGPASLQIISDDNGLSGAGGTRTDTDEISITVNSISPTVNTTGSLSPDGTYKIGDEVILIVTFDQTVTVDESGGSPALLLETGDTDREAVYDSGSGSNTLAFTYTVEAGDHSADLDYASTAALALNGATIRNTAADDAVLTLPAVGGSNSIAGQHGIVIDGVAPAAPSRPLLYADDDTGTSGSDHITNVVAPRFTGTAEVGSTVRLYDTDGVTELGQAVATDGNWTITSDVLTEDTHTLTAIATDAAGNPGEASAERIVVIDITAPAKPAVPDLAPASDSGESNTDNITNLTDLTLQGAVGSVEANTALHARSALDGGLTGGTANADGSWSFDVLALAEGTHELQINATDAAGNTSVYSDAVTVVIDATAPDGHSVGFDDDAINATEAASIGFSFRDAEVGTGYSYTIASSGGGTPVTGNGTIATTTDPISGIDVSGLSDGTLTLSVMVMDAAGNSASAVTDAAILDRVVPEVEGVESGEYYKEDVTPTFDEGTALLNGNPYVSGTPITAEGGYKLVVADAVGNMTVVAFTIDKTVPEVIGVVSGEYYNENVTPTFDEGTALLNGNPYVSGTPITAEGGYKLVVTDAAGNMTVVAFTIDKTAPEITGVDDGASYNTDVTPAFNEGTATLNGEAFTPGTVVTDEDEYTLVITDAAGNADTVMFTIDRTLPEITGVEDGAFYRDDVVVTFNEGKAMLDGEPFPSGGTLDTEGDYTLIVTDAAGNSDTVRFTIDKTVPEVTGVVSGEYYNEDVTPTFDEGTATLNGESYVSGTPITAEGGYKLLVTDAAGNMTVVAFTIDKTVPEITGVEDGALYNEEVTVSFNEGTATLNGAAFASGTVVTDEDAYILVVTDASGNADTVRFTIDRTVPEVTGVVSGEYYNEDVTPTFDEGTATLNGESYVSGTPIMAEGGYKLLVTDAAGNMTVVAFTIDKTVPEITGVDDGASYNTGVTPTFNEGTATLNGEAFTSGTLITEEDAYTLVVTDAAGNADTVRFTIDKTLPEITGVDDGASYNTDVTPAFNEGTATLNGEAFTSGTLVTEEGEYELLVTDASGNADTVRFTIDKTLPEITGVEDGASYNTDVTPAFNEGEAVLNGEPFTSGTPVAEDNEYTLVVTDTAGNADTVRFVIDKTAPLITGVDDGASYNTDVTPAFNEGTATLNGEAFTSGTLITEEDAYTLVVIDASGNADTVRFVIDKTAPEIMGVDDGASYRDDVVVTFNEGKAMLDGEPFPSGGTLDTEGDYTLIVTDAAGNADTVRFTIDKTVAEITGVDDSASYNTDVTPAFNEGTATLNGEAFTSGTLVTEEGEYELLVTDAAGNMTVAAFTIDKTAPEITGVEDGASYNTDVTAAFNEGTATLNGAAFASGTVVTDEDEYTLVVTDAAGNADTVRFTIDSGSPVITGATDGASYNTDVTPAFNEGTATLNGEAFTPGTVITEEDEYTLTVTDAAGNETTVSFAIDKTAPAITGVEEGGLYAGAATASFNEGTATLNGAPYAAGTPVTVPGEYTLTVTDAAGNVTTVRFTVGALPGAPRGLSATAGNRQVMLEWDAPAGGIPAVTDYVIGYSRDGGSTWTEPAREPSAATRSLVIGLENNRPYLFRVSAVNGVGRGAASGTVQAIPAEPVPDVGGNLPEPEPGVPVVVTDGKVEAVMLEVVDGEYLRLSGDGYAMELASLGADGERIPISAVDAVIRLLKGNGTQVYISGHGFEPGTVVTVYLFSNPELVGHLPVDGDGNFGGSLPVPANLELGRHTLQANGVIAGGNGERSVSVGLELVDRKPQWVSFGALADRIYGDGPVTLEATATSGLAVTYAVTDADGTPTDIASIENNKLTIHGAGEVVVTATQGGNADYPAAVPVSRTLHIARAPLSVRTSDATRAYGGDNPSFELTYEGFVNGDDAPALAIQPAAATEATATSAPGDYAITITGGESANYAFTYHGATLTITKASQAITLYAPVEVTRDAGSIQLDVSSSSGLPVSLTADDPQVAVLSGSVLDIQRLGTVRITATQAGDGNHEAAGPVTVTIRVTDPSSDFPIRVHRALSPNGDGINEYLIIEAIRDHAENRVTIFSRNGTLLWEASGYDNDRVVFRGISTGGQQLPAGTYFYIVEVKVNGKWEHRKGYFVIRY